jgi:chemotaxis protein histidine kinase CheA
MTPIDPANSTAEMLAQLRADYAAALPGKLDGLERLCREVMARRAPPEQLEDLIRMAHAISGSGATFGLPSVSAAARDLELFLDRNYRTGPALPDVEAQARVSELVRALKNAVSAT